MKQLLQQNSKDFLNEVLEARRKAMGEQVKSRRQDLGMSQDKLSYLSGIRKATLVDLELGRNVEANTILTIVDFLGGSVEMVWNETPVTETS